MSMLLVNVDLIHLNTDKAPYIRSFQNLSFIYQLCIEVLRNVMHVTVCYGTVY